MDENMTGANNAVSPNEGGTADNNPTDTAENTINSTDKDISAAGGNTGDNDEADSEDDGDDEEGGTQPEAPIIKAISDDVIDILHPGDKLHPTPRATPDLARLQYSAYADMRPAPTSKYATVGFSVYMVLMLVFGLPVIGFIVALIMALAAKRIAIRNFALGTLCYQMVILILVFAAILISIYICETSPLDFLAKIGITISLP